MTKKGMKLRKLFRIMYETEVEVGKNNELRVFRAFTDEYPFQNRIHWIHSVRLVTEEEDVAGIDIIFETDVGQIHLQLKSSFKGKEKFLKEQVEGVRDLDIACAVIHPSYNAERICRIVTPILSRVRKQRLNTKGQLLPTSR